MALIQWRWAYVAAYIVLWSTQALLIKSSSIDGRYPYEVYILSSLFLLIFPQVMSMTLAIETFKLTLALSLFFLTRKKTTQSCF
jgi:hypothetical protein